MFRQCTVTRGEHTMSGGFALDADSLVFTLSGAAPWAVPLREIAGIDSDEAAIELLVGHERIVLSRLGAESSTLRAALLAAWLPARAQALRLGGDGPLLRFTATVAGPQHAPQPCLAAVAQHSLLVAPAGRDLYPLFLAEVAAVEFDPEGWAITNRLWGGERITLTRLAGQTDEVFRALLASRAALADTATAVLGRWLPTVPAADRSRLAADWLPGRFLPLDRLEELAPGAADAVFASWVAAQPRRHQGEALRQWAGDGAVAAGYAVAAGEVHLWLLAWRGGRFLLESVSHDDWATYRFAGGDELLSLATRLLCAPQFSREALYLPLEELTGERSAYAVAARSLPFLRALRERFRGRIVHQDVRTWRVALDAD